MYFMILARHSPYNVKKLGLTHLLLQQGTKTSPLSSSSERKHLCSKTGHVGTSKLTKLKFDIS